MAAVASHDVRWVTQSQNQAGRITVDYSKLRTRNRRSSYPTGLTELILDNTQIRYSVIFIIGTSAISYDRILHIYVHTTSAAIGGRTARIHQALRVASILVVHGAASGHRANVPVADVL